MAQNDMGGQRKWLRVLHRIGYVTTALILAELLLLGFMITRTWLQNREMDRRLIEASRTHEGAIKPTSTDGAVGGSAIYLFGQLPPLASLHGDGIRFVAMPSFNRSHFAVAVHMPTPDAEKAEGVVASFDQRNEYAPISQRRFQMPASTYRALAAKMDKLTDGWPGDPELCLDGTPTAFERVRGRRITSGIGNCSQHYEHVGRLVWNYLHEFAPGGDLPNRGDWEPSD